MSHLKITMLVENTSRAGGGTRGITSEHGLAMLVEVDGVRVLLDTGQGKCLLPNAKALDIDLGHLDAVALSHGHYDHTGGLEGLLMARGPTTIYAHPDVFLPKYSCPQNRPSRYIGMPWQREQLGHLGGQFVLNAGSIRLSERMLLTGEIPRTCAFEDTPNDFRVRAGDQYKKDRLLDDQSLIVEGDDHVVVVTGCAHAGLINTLTWALRLTGKPVRGFIGGTHLIDAEIDRLYLTLDALDKFRLEFLSPCHCTGFKAMAMMHVMFGERYRESSTPSVMELEI